MKRRWIMFFGLCALLMAIGIVAWIRYPKPPDIRKLSIDQILAYMASDDFNNLRASQRRAFAIASAEKMRDKRFGEILWMMARPDPRREKRFANLRKIPDREEIGAAYMRVFLESFYREPPVKQKIYLGSFAVLQQTEIAH